MKFKRAGSRDFIDYEGDRSLESLIAFAEDNAKNSLVIPEKEKPVEKAEEVPADGHDAAQTPVSVPPAEETVAHEEL